MTTDTNDNAANIAYDSALYVVRQSAKELARVLAELPTSMEVDGLEWKHVRTLCGVATELHDSMAWVGRLPGGVPWAEEED